MRTRDQDSAELQKVGRASSRCLEVHGEVVPYPVYVQALRGAPKPVTRESECPSWLLRRE